VLDSFREIIFADFEFRAPPGERPDVHCLVFRELRSGRTTRLWRDQLGPAAPYSTDPDTLFVAYYASAEIGCHLALGWQVPTRVLDLFVEFSAYVNCARPKGSPAPKRGLLPAMIHFGLDGIGATEKAGMRDLAVRGGPFTEQERSDLLDYCCSDVDAMCRLLPALLPYIDLPRALLRGRYMTAAARVEHNGVPIDVDKLNLFRRQWYGIQDQLIADVDTDYGVFEGRTFKRDKFATFLTKADIAWPRLDSGELDLSDETFRQMARSQPAVAPLRELRSSLAGLRLNDLAVGEDGRNRTMLSAFSSASSRNQPSNSKFIFGPSTWIRGLIKPPPGHGVAYLDWSQQEFGIAAVLSRDENMLAAYRSGDPYLDFAKQAGAVPADATKKTHGPARDLFKQCVLAVQYGQGAEGLARRIDKPEIVARTLMEAHRATFSRFWRWSDAAVDQAMLRGALWTVFGWPIRSIDGSNPRSLRNFPCQANGAEMMRIASCLSTERGIEVCAPVHDAFLICAPLDRLDDDVASMQAIMREASAAVLDGFELGTDATVVRFPDRYMDARGAVMWDRVLRLAQQAEVVTA
jgi:DNA polymerase I